MLGGVALGFYMYIPCLHVNFLPQVHLSLAIYYMYFVLHSHSNVMSPIYTVQHICDRIWKNPPCCYFREYLHGAMYQYYYYATNVAPSLTAIACSVSEIRGFLCAHAHSITLEKLRSKDVAMHAGGVSVNYAYALIESGRRWVEPSNQKKRAIDSTRRHKQSLPLST